MDPITIFMVAGVLGLCLGAGMGYEIRGMVTALSQLPAADQLAQLPEHCKGSPYRTPEPPIQAIVPASASEQEGWLARRRRMKKTREIVRLGLVDNHHLLNRFVAMLNVDTASASATRAQLADQMDAGGLVLRVLRAEHHDETYADEALQARSVASDRDVLLAAIGDPTSFCRWALSSRYSSYVQEKIEKNYSALIKVLEKRGFIDSEVARVVVNAQAIWGKATLEATWSFLTKIEKGNPGTLDQLQS